MCCDTARGQQLCSLLVAVEMKTGSGSVAVAAVGQADSGRSSHVVVEADIFVVKEEDTITWL